LCGKNGDMTGDTVLCRRWYVQKAKSSPDTECADAGPNSSVCI